MGISANQARLLTLTARQHDLELRAQQISARKMVLAMNTQQTALNYSNQLNAYYLSSASTNKTTYITEKQYFDAEYYTQKGYTVKDSNGTVVDITGKSGADMQALLEAGHKVFKTVMKTTIVGGVEDVSKVAVNVKKEAFAAEFSKYGNTSRGDNAYDWLCGGNSDFDGSFKGFNNFINDQGETCYYIEFNEGYVDNYGDAWFENAYNTIQAAQSTLYWTNTASGHPDYATEGYLTEEELIATIKRLGYEIPVSGGTPVETSEEVEVSESQLYQINRIPVDNGTGTETESEISVDLAQVQADYDSAMKELSLLEKLLDMELTQIDTEHKAVKTEYDSVKSLISDNVEKSFNVFG